MIWTDLLLVSGASFGVFLILTLLIVLAITAFYERTALYPLAAAGAVSALLAALSLLGIAASLAWFVIGRVL